MSRPTISPRSCPAQNAGPAPSITIARTLVSAPRRSTAAVTSCMTSRLSALRCLGRLRVIRASGPSWRTSTGPAVVVSSALMGPTIRPRGALAKDEAELRPPAAARAPDVHQQRAVDDRVRAVARLAREVELRREDRAVRALHLDVDVAGGGPGPARDEPGPRPAPPPPGRA